MSIFNEGNNSKSEKPISTPTPVSKKRKRNTPVIDVADRRRAVLPKIRYACTRMKIFTTKEKSDFMCGCCYQKYPNKEVAGLVITDSSSLPACLPCSDFVREIIWVLIKAVETGFGEPKDDHPVAQAMKSVKKAHYGQHLNCAACNFLISCRRAHQWRKIDDVKAALSKLQGCPEEYASKLIELADKQARRRVRGRNHGKVDKSKLDAFSTIMRVASDNVGQIITGIERAAGVLHVRMMDARGNTELTKLTKQAETLADNSIKEWVEKNPTQKTMVPMFVRVQSINGEHIGVFANKLTVDEKDHKIVNDLDNFYRIAQSLNPKVAQV